MTVYTSFNLRTAGMLLGLTAWMATPTDLRAASHPSRVAADGGHQFLTPPPSGRGRDRVIVLDAVARGFGPSGRSETADVRAADHPGAAAVLPFIDDDYARARAEARAREVPLFIEAWAPW